MTDVVVSFPPATGVWWDEGATLASILLQLRLRGADVDQARIEALIPAAGRLIDTYLDRETVVDGPPPAANLQDALEAVTINLYLRLPVSVPPLDVTAAYLASDPLVGVLAQIAPDKQRWGIA